jgi:adenylylsulfate kinase
MQHRSGIVLWLTGLSGAGKSTLAASLAEVLRGQGHRVEVLDGDVRRKTVSPELGFTRNDRDQHVLQSAEAAELLARNGAIAIVAMISPYRETREQARRMCARFVEVHVATPLDVCIRRDVKGLYARALRNEIPHFTGVSDPYEEPLGPELRLDTSHISVTMAVDRIFAVLSGIL